MLEAIQTINYLNEELEKKKNLEKLPTFCRLCIKPGIQERVTECGKRGEQGECYIPGCYIPENVAKYSGECLQTSWGMSLNIPGNLVKHSVECPQIFREISPNIPGNALKCSLLLTNNAVKGQAFKVNGRAQFYEFISLFAVDLTSAEKVP